MHIKTLEIKDNFSIKLDSTFRKIENSNNNLIHKVLIEGETQGSTLLLKILAG
jgi:hypothetical protein